MTPNPEGGAIFEVGVYFADTEYGVEDDGAKYFAKSAALKRRLEEEYKITLQHEDIAPGWSFPAFGTLVAEYWPAGVIALFLAGEKIEKNIDAWGRLHDRLKRFFSKPVFLDRNGALVLASSAVIEKSASLPRALSLTGYEVWSALEGDAEHTQVRIAGFADPPATSHLSLVIHIFQIAADDREFKAYVRGSDVQLIELPPRSSL